MKIAATETIRSMALLVIAAFPTVALIASFPSHAQTREAAAPAASSLAAAVTALPLATAPVDETKADEDGAIASGDEAQRERRCERTRRIGKVTQTRCD